MDGWLTYPANSTRFEDAERSLSSDTITASSASHSNRTGIPKSADDDEHQIEMQVLDRGDSANSNDKDGLILRALGKKQLLHRNFGFISMVGFISSMMATWETEGFVIQGGLLNGGPVALVYGFILCFIGNLATSASIAELASIFPTAGGQYHFVALLCPRPCREFLSWLAGWISVFAWQAVTASWAYVASTSIQGMLILNYDSYDPQRWHTTLLFLCIILLAVFFNTFLARSLPMIESFVLIIHIGSFFCIIIPLIMFGPLNDASFVFTKFVNSAGWKSDAVSWSVGLITSTYPFLCYDGACHMSEEIKSAPIVVPCSILTSVVLNGILGFVFLIVTLFTMGDIRLVLGSHTSHAMIVIFFNATRSKVGTTVMISFFTMIAIFAATTAMTSTSRLMWAFARDNGLPFSGFLTKLQPRWNIPLHSIALSAALNVVLSLIIVASATAFSAIISLNVVALYVTYMLPILLMLRLRIKYPNSIQYGPFKLGKLGIPLNGISVLYVIYTGVFLLFPGALPVTPSSMNYSCLALGAAIFLVVGMWFVKGRKEYKGPLKEI